MELQHIPPSAFQTTRWSGGSTTQIAIGPETANYADRDFLWRVSSARVETEESEFTLLPDYTRYISVLEGGIEIAHNGGAAVPLLPYQVHAFSGGDATRAWGKCVDFNLMLRTGKCRGDLQALHLPPDEEAAIPLMRGKPCRDAAVLYCAEGGGFVTAAGKQRILLQRGEAVLIREGVALVAAGEAPTVVMLARIRETV